MGGDLKKELLGCDLKTLSQRARESYENLE